MDHKKGDFDVIVVGAGVGGLTAGALAAARGHRVLVMEQRRQPGGCCGALQCDGYRFDIGPSLFYGFGRQGFDAHRRVLDELEVDLETRFLDPGFSFFFEETALPVHRRLETYIARLVERFPSLATGLSAFYRKLQRVFKDILEVAFLPVADASLFDLTRLAFGNPGLLFTYLPILDQSLWQFTEPFLQSGTPHDVGRLKALFDADMLLATGVTADAVPVILAACILLDRHVGGICYPRGGAAAVAETLVRGLEKHGGVLRCETRVERILTRGGKVEGVRLADGAAIAAHSVISNVSIWTTFEELLDPHELQADRQQEVEGLAPSISPFITCLAVEADVIPDGFDRHTILVPADSGVSEEALVITIPSLLEAHRAPPGHHAVTVMSVEQYDDWIPPGFQRAREDAKRARARARQDCALAETVLPSITRKSEIKATFSPAWMETQLGRRYGTVGGPAQSAHQSLNHRQGNNTEIAGLYLVGDSTYPGEGVVAAAVSAVTCVDQIAAQKGPKRSPWASFFSRLSYQKTRTSKSGEYAAITDDRPAVKPDAQTVARMAGLGDGTHSETATETATETETERKREST